MSPDMSPDAVRVKFAREVKDRARKVGFPLVGIAPAEPPPHSEKMASWLASDHAGEMTYLMRDPATRADPRRVLPGARSAVVVGVPYLPPEPAAADQRDFAAPRGREDDAGESRPSVGPRGVVSAYARGDDYHRLMEARLAALERELALLMDEGLRSLPADERGILFPTGPPVFRSYCDHGPLLERGLGARAGLGWIGKNTLLLHPSFGSWFFLGVLLTSADLAPDEEVPDRCGRCRRCLDACPTGALLEPYVLDARRCISYLTIEVRGVIPRELRPAVGARIFGCDDCQTVCPWTPTPRQQPQQPSAPAGPCLSRSAGPPAPPLFAPRAELAALDLARCIAIREEEFEELYGATPLARTRRRGLCRNAALALGNVGGREAVESLGRALTDRESLVRTHAAWALGAIASRCGGPTAAQCAALLAAAATSETEPAVQEEMRAALRDRGSD